MFFRKSFLFLHQKPFASHQFPFNFSTVPPKPNIPLKVQKQLKEKDMYDRLKSQLQATFVEVIDTSNSGCGQMYKLSVESPIFEGKSKLEQHRMVNEVLKEDIKQIHGLNIKTTTPKTK